MRLRLFLKAQCLLGMDRTFQILRPKYGTIRTQTEQGREPCYTKGLFLMLPDQSHHSRNIITMRFSRDFGK